ncbi:hypothetical protein [Teredinibacter purpureus]|uniref:hypothetical protein n=1 Tax=Teredinibacter purpureus TaxID=2731756 RepID=UPI0005F82AC3|nr:hypothetical protein [Teredinibacter purpureus]
MKLKRKHILTFCFITVFISPVALYGYQFGIGLWSEHTKWAEFGSFFSGVYSPVVALFAFVVLLVQAGWQSKINKYQYDTSYISANRDDIAYYIEKMEQYLEKKDEQGASLSQQLVQHYYTKSEVDLLQERDHISNYITAFHPKIFGIWNALYPILNAMGSNDEFPYRHNYLGSIQKIETILTLPVCVAIDKVYFCINRKVNPSETIFWKGCKNITSGST